MLIHNRETRGRLVVRSTSDQVKQLNDETAAILAALKGTP